MIKRQGKGILAVFLAALCLLLCACRDRPDAHPEWGDAFRMGEWLAVSSVPEGFTFSESSDVLSPVGLCYATWIKGEERDVKNESGVDAKAYDAQIYLLVKECRSAESAQAELENWIEREKSAYTTGEEQAAERAGQAYTLLTLVSGRETNAYKSGGAAFGRRGELAIVVEIVCIERAGIDALAVLSGFLDGFLF